VKILFVSSTYPTKKSGPNSYISNLIKYMRTRNKIELFWIICEKDRISESIKDDEKIYDIRKFSDATDILDKIKPDVVLAINNKYEPLQYAISIASKFKKILLIHFKIIEKIEEEISSGFQLQKISKNFQQLLNDEDLKKIKSSNRISFILFKHNFLNKTRSKTGINFLKNIQLFLNDISSHFQEKQRMDTIADLQLVNNKSWYDLFKNLGFDEKNLALTGSPYWDPIFEKLQHYNSDSNQNQGKIRVLIITTPLVEHGYGTYSERDFLLKSIFEELKSENIEFALKIHPSSERKTSYLEFLKKINLKIPIYQNEKLWDIIHDYDIILIYGYGYPQIECAFGGIRTILLKTKWKFPEIQIVKSAINAGYFRKCENVHEIKLNIVDMISKKIEINEEVLSERENICFKFDGKSSERATKAILAILGKQD